MAQLLSNLLAVTSGSYLFYNMYKSGCEEDEILKETNKLPIILVKDDEDIKNVTFKRFIAQVDISKCEDLEYYDYTQNDGLSQTFVISKNRFYGRTVFNADPKDKSKETYLNDKSGKDEIKMGVSFNVNERFTYS